CGMVHRYDHHKQRSYHLYQHLLDELCPKRHFRQHHQILVLQRECPIDEQLHLSAIQEAVRCSYVMEHPLGLNKYLLEYHLVSMACLLLEQLQQQYPCYRDDQTSCPQLESFSFERCKHEPLC